ncbi:MAG TPA: tRNA (5-methylaminomethyl-2-thiouridine)(34)-methyltransferase MnmD [Bacteroidales bacterium]|nr:tRNA (5-methylaminomethyl-2-thiouridine)(34)-methyltransferase MnmD [Bacteroidales bacterium]HRZ49063.1 tRNA (5-methylaminomethyl-2-thiouridine)(34)-methyltransferase MnmD [Bacteroidales bacterium]
MEPFSLKLTKTADGSHTLFVPELNEHYHSVNGAVAESEHVFIGAGLSFATRQFKEIRALEVGFGTGLNALLAFAFAEANHLQLSYTGLEPNPPAAEILDKLNYRDLSIFPAIPLWWQRIHCLAPWDTTTAMGDLWSLTKCTSDLEDFGAPEGSFNLVFFDAFAPQVQPALWTAAMFQKIAGMLETGGILVTYSSKGEVRRNLKTAGFVVEKIPGPAGKREMVRAIRLPLQHG